MISKVTKYEFKKLNQFVKAVDDHSIVKVGIFGDKNERIDGEVTNAEIGAVHEFGSITHKIPPRSFLRMPIFQKSEEIIEGAAPAVEEMISDGNAMGVLAELGRYCENAVQRAFATMGFGSWKRILPATIKRKGSSRELIDTGQLRRSIVSKVERRG
jgi:phage gpG-like protein